MAGVAGDQEGGVRRRRRERRSGWHPREIGVGEHLPVVLGVPGRQPFGEDARQRGDALGHVRRPRVPCRSRSGTRRACGRSARPPSRARRQRRAIAASSSWLNRARSTMAIQHMSSVSPIRISQSGQAERPGRTPWPAGIRRSRPGQDRPDDTLVRRRPSPSRSEPPSRDRESRRSRRRRRWPRSRTESRTAAAAWPACSHCDSSRRRAARAAAARPDSRAPRG